jgi:hypothetical protein
MLKHVTILLISVFLLGATGWSQNSTKVEVFGNKPECDSFLMQNSTLNFVESDPDISVYFSSNTNYLGSGTETDAKNYCASAGWNYVSGYFCSGKSESNTYTFYLYSMEYKVKDRYNNILGFKAQNRALILIASSSGSNYCNKGGQGGYWFSAGGNFSSYSSFNFQTPWDFALFETANKLIETNNPNILSAIGKFSPVATTSSETSGQVEVQNSGRTFTLDSSCHKISWSNISDGDTLILATDSGSIIYPSGYFKISRQCSDIPDLDCCDYDSNGLPAWEHGFFNSQTGEHLVILRAFSRPGVWVEKKIHLIYQK